MTSNRFEELEAFLLDWEEGTLGIEGTSRLREILKTDGEARANFIRLQMMNAALHLEGDAGLVSPSVGRQPPVETSPAVTQRRSRVPIRWLVAAATLLLCVLSGRLAWLEFGNGAPRQVRERAVSERDPTKEATSQGVALATRLVDVTWSKGQSPFGVGDALPPGRLAIESGFAQIEFFCGATVVLEGPAVLELESATHASVHSGRLRAQVPPAARGFSIEVGAMTVVDLGTEFAISVSGDGANVQVFAGEVELQHPSEEKQLLAAGEALIRTADGAYAKTKVTPELFLDIESLESRAQQRRGARFQEWQAWSHKLRRDPRLIAYYAFDQKGGWQRRLQSSIEPTNSELDGAIVGARRTSGRWPSNNKRGLEFKRPGDRVRVQIPGEYSSLTFSCWVRIDSLDRWYNSLFLTDGYNQGEPHWQILDTGQLFFSVRVSDVNGGPEHREVLSPPFWTPSLSGKWVHLATTYDVDAQLVTHYVDGQVLHEENIPNFQLVRTTRFGRATIGNWSSPQRPDAHFAIRNLNGSMDEFALFSAALTNEEIKEIYENGKP